MASPNEVKIYLAYWFQLGKSVHINNGRITQRPGPVLEGNQFSRAFQDCWQAIMAVGGRDCYLDGSQETIEQLLSPEWEITDCARCNIPTAMPTVMPVAQLCPCGDIDTWPNDELPAPHMPINNNKHFGKLKMRLDEDNLKIRLDEDKLKMRLDEHPRGDHQLKHEVHDQKTIVNNRVRES